MLAAFGTTDDAAPDIFLIALAALNLADTALAFIQRFVKQFFVP